MLEDKKLNAMMALMGVSDDDPWETQLEKIGVVITQIFNQMPELKMEGFTWKVDYPSPDEPDKMRCAKMDGEKTIAAVVLHTETGKYETDAKDDPDIKKLVTIFLLGIIAG